MPTRFAPLPQRRTVLRLAAVATTALALAWPALAQPQAPVRLRGKIESVSADKLVLLERSGERIELALPANLVVTEAFAVPLTDIQPNSFVGVGAMPQPD